MSRMAQKWNKATRLEGSRDRGCFTKSLTMLISACKKARARNMHTCDDMQTHSQPVKTARL